MLIFFKQGLGNRESAFKRILYFTAQSKISSNEKRVAKGFCVTCENRAKIIMRRVKIKKLEKTCDL